MTDNILTIIKEKVVRITASSLCIMLLIIYQKTIQAAEIVNSAPSSAVTTDPMSSSYLMQLIVGLLIVLLCIVVLAWMAKRLNRFQAISAKSMRILGSMSMGARERVVLIQVGTTQLLLGVTSGQINKLHILDENIEINSTLDGIPDINKLSKSFSEKLSAALTKRPQ